MNWKGVCWELNTIHRTLIVISFISGMNKRWYTSLQMGVIKCVLNMVLEMKGYGNWYFDREDHVSLPYELSVTWMWENVNFLETDGQRLYTGSCALYATATRLASTYSSISPCH
jgi:hypothetical protein